MASSRTDIPGAGGGGAPAAARRRLSYHRRLFLWLLLYSALLVGCFVIFQYRREKEFKASEIDSQLQLINTYILTELAEGKEISEINLREFHPFDELRVSVIDSAGAVLYDNSLDSVPGSNHLNRTEIRHALARGTGYAVRRHSESTGGVYFYSARRGPEGSVVRTAVPYSVSLSALLEADYGFLWITGAIALVMCALGYMVTRRLGAHIMRLSRFAEKAERGERISDTTSFPHDELGDISSHIVRLYARLQQAIADRDREHRVALFAQQEKERIKKQLTNNINHELKTPVASIQICVETLLTHRDLTEEKKELFLQRCLFNTRRLHQLLADVALITRMDDGHRAIIKESADLADIISEAVGDRNLMAREKGIRIIDEVTGPLPMHANRQLMLSVFFNLIDNAISYSGATEIRIRAVRSTPSSGSPRSASSASPAAAAASVTILLWDNGTGVPPEHLPHIFERFYRVDKGRSRSAGGTGLGLSIVKNAILIHGGTVTASNRPEGGLSFTATLPLSVINQSN